MVATTGVAFEQATGQYVRLGRQWPVLPLCWPDAQGECACGGEHAQAGKAPLLTAGYKGASFRRNDLRLWARRWPEANVGIALADAGLVVVDCDSDDAVAEAGRLGVDGAAWVQTGKGRHYYFTRPDGCPATRRTRRGASEAIDILADGYVVAPPSRHRTGATYAWHDDAVDLTPAPDWVVRWLSDAVAVDASATDMAPVTAFDGDNLPGRPTSKARALWTGEEWHDRPDGGRDRSKTFFHLACELARSGNDAPTVASLLKAWDLRHDGKYHTRRDFDHQCRAIASRAIDEARRNPGPVDVDWGDVFDGPTPATTDGQTARRRRESEVDVVRRYVGTMPPTAFTGGDWFEYGDGWWQSLTTHDMASRVHRLLGDASRASLISAVRAVLSAETNLPDDAWDRAPDVMVFENGALELHATDASWSFREHRRTDLARTRIPYRYDPDARSPEWEAFLADRFAPAVASYVQEFAGYALSRDVRHESALWLFGPPGGGKSTFIGAMEAMLGPERCGRLSLADISKSRFALAQVPGKTLLVASEQPTQYLDCSDVVNALISGDTLLVERKYVDARAIQPVAKILWAMNTLPTVGSAVDGIFRRVRIVRMEAIGQPDHTVRDRIVANPAGILNWALTGWRRLVGSGQRLGDRAPDAVRHETKLFELENDHVRAFLDECVEVSTGAELASTALDDAYKAWCDRRAIKRPIYYGKRGEHYRRCGLPEPVHTRAGNVYPGYRLRLQ